MKVLPYHIYVIGANLIWGLYATVCKSFLASALVSSWALCGLKMIGGTVLFWGISFLLPEKMLPKDRVERRDFVKLFCASMLINAGSQSCIILGLNHTSPVDGTVICSMAPIFTVVLAILLLGQSINFLKTIGVILGFTGAMLFVFPGLLDGSVMISNIPNGDNPLLGNSLIIASQVFGALYLLLFTNILKRYSAVTVIKWLFLFSAIALAPITAYDIYNSNWIEMTVTNWLQLGYIIVLATGVAYFLLIIGQKQVSPTAIAMYNYVQPITAMVSSVTTGIAVINGQELLATLVCLIGVYFVIKY